MLELRFPVSLKSFVFWGFLLYHAPIDAQLQIPIEDQRVLTDFFKGLLTQGPFAITLFGQKSACTFDYPFVLVPKMNDIAFKIKFLLEHKGWRLWENINTSSTLITFFFCIQKGGFLSVIFVHKEKMVSILTEHREFFQNHFSKDPFSHDLEKFLQSAFIPDFKRPNFHLAQGLLLSYDPKSCLDFQHRSSIEDTLSFFPYYVPETITASNPDRLLDGHPEDLIQKQEHFNDYFALKRNWPSENPFFCSFSPGYMAFDIPQDSHISDLHEKIINLYNSDQFLEDFIKILTQ